MESQLDRAWTDTIMLDEEQDAVLRNPFPSPPSHYQNYGAQNLALLKLLKSRTSSQPEASASHTNEDSADADENAYAPLNVTLEQQRELLKDQEHVPEWSLSQLEKPRVDWILEDGHYNVFGDTWFVRIGAFLFLSYQE